MEELANRYLERADEARQLSGQIGQRESRRSLALLAAMRTALARHAQRARNGETADDSQGC